MAITPTRIRDLLRDGEGALLLEYALLVVLIAVVCIGAIALFGDTVKEILERNRGRILDAIT